MNERFSPFVVKEKHTSSDFSQVVAAASKSSQQINSITFKQNEKVFNLTIEQIGVIVGIVALSIFFVSSLAVGITPTQMLMDGTENLEAMRTIIYSTVGASALAFIALLVFASMNMNAQTLYNVEYESNIEIGAGTQTHTFRVELRERNQIRFEKLPTWFTDQQLFALAGLAQESEFAFNRATISASGIATSTQFPQLKQSFENCKFIEKNGKSYTLTDSFFAFAEQVEKSL